MTTISLPIALPLQAAPPTTMSPLSPAQIVEYQASLLRSKKIRRAIVVALTDAWLSAIFAGLTILSGIFSLTALLLGVALAFVAFNSFRGARGLKRFDITAPKLLALNQLLLIGILTLYALYSIWSARNGDSEVAHLISSNPSLTDSLGDLKQMIWYLTLAVYGGLIIATLLAQGGAALYYITRKKHLVTYIDQTPPWIISLQKAQAGV
jgi:hypothetical protein